MLRITFFILTVSLCCQVAFGKSVAVVAPVCTDADTGETLGKTAQEISDTISSAASDAGFEVVAGEDVQFALENLSTAGICDKDCLQQLAVQLNVDEAMWIHFEDENQMTFRTRVLFANREPIIDERTAGYFVVREWFKGAITMALQASANEESQVGPVAPQPANDDAVGSTNSNSDAGLRQELPNKSRKKLSKVPFFIAAGITVAFGATTLVLDGIGHRKYNSAEDDIAMGELRISQIESKIDQIENLQLATKIALAATGAALATTVVLAFFTRFKKESVSTGTAKVTIKPGVAIGSNLGGLTLLGSF